MWTIFIMLITLWSSVCMADSRSCKNIWRRNAVFGPCDPADTEWVVPDAKNRKQCFRSCLNNPECFSYRIRHKECITSSCIPTKSRRGRGSFGVLVRCKTPTSSPTRRVIIPHIKSSPDASKKVEWEEEEVEEDVEEEVEEEEEEVEDEEEVEEDEED